MFALPLPLPTTGIDTLAPLKALLTQSAWWPAWLQEGESWCLAVLPAWVLVQTADTLVCLSRQPDLSYSAVPMQGEMLALLKLRWHANSQVTHFDIGFNGGLLGWLGYDYAQGQARNKHAIDFPVACFAFYDVFIRPDESGQVAIYAAHQALAEVVFRQYNTPVVTHFELTQPFCALMSKGHYVRAFERVQQYLHSGDCYQVNLAQAFKALCHGDSALPAFIALLTLSQATYAAYLNSPYGEILSLSPELFLTFEANGGVVTRPIKGTRPRRAEAGADAAELNDLAHHPKDRAENVMIVDLLRNDLGKHAVIGSVKVPTLFEVVSFPQVHHLVSTVTCRLKPDAHPLDMLFDAFPGGSITGAPKKRAMEIIDELENCQRAIYCGSIGYLTNGNRGHWNIAIRTLLRVDNALYAWAGGGIVADSDCESEYQECFNKMGAMLRLLEARFLPSAN